MLENLQTADLGLLVAFAVINIPIVWIVAKMFWNDLEEFMESLRFWFTPEIVSALRGEWVDDQWNELKMLLFLFLCGAVFYSEYILYIRITG